MKNFVLTLILLSSSFLSYGQQPDPVLARVTFNFSHVRDTNSKDNPYTERMLLVVGKETSVYTSLDRIGRDLNLPSARPTPNAPFKPVTFIDQYFFPTANKAFTRQRFMNAYYLIEEPSYKINWKITKDTASVGGILCKKAIAHFKGRNWIAWYAPEIPLQSGPWKLNGLPGLILEAHDDKKEVFFRMQKFDNLKLENLKPEEEREIKQYQESIFFAKEIALQSDAKKTTRAEFDKVYEVYQKDPIGFISAESGTPRNKIFVGTSTTGVSHNVINNPLELPEKSN